MDHALGDVSEMGKTKEYACRIGGGLIFKWEKYELGPAGVDVEDGSKRGCLKGPTLGRSEVMNASLGSFGGK